MKPLEERKNELVTAAVDLVACYKVRVQLQQENSKRQSGVQRLDDRFRDAANAFRSTADEMLATARLCRAVEEYNWATGDQCDPKP